MKLLDEKGLTTVWAAIKNTFTSKSDADEKYAKKTDLADYATKSQAMHSMDVYHTATDIQISLKGVNDFPLGFIAMNAVTSQSAGVMIPSDKTKLDGIATGANNYTLPIATTSTRGGIMSTTQEFSGNFGWPIYVIPDGRAFTYIPGLYVNGSNGSIKDIKVNNLDKQTSAIYNSEGIIRQTSNGYTTMSLPAKGGTLALTSDLENIQLKKGNTTYDDGIIQRAIDNSTKIIGLPNDSGTLALSNALRFNFAGSINNCEDRKINFVFGSGLVNLDSLKNRESGTIIFFAAGNSCSIKYSHKDWMFNGVPVSSGSEKDLFDGSISIITVNQEAIIVYRL